MAEAQRLKLKVEEKTLLEGAVVRENAHPGSLGALNPVTGLQPLSSLRRAGPFPIWNQSVVPCPVLIVAS